MHFSNCIRVGSLYRSLGARTSGERTPWNKAWLRSEITRFGAFSDLFEHLKATPPIKNSWREIYFNMDAEIDPHKWQHHIRNPGLSTTILRRQFERRMGNLVSSRHFWNLKHCLKQAKALRPCKHLHPTFFHPIPRGNVWSYHKKINCWKTKENGGDSISLHKTKHAK